MAGEEVVGIMFIGFLSFFIASLDAILTPKTQYIGKWTKEEKKKAKKEWEEFVRTHPTVGAF